MRTVIRRIIITYGDQLNDIKGKSKASSIPSELIVDDQCFTDVNDVLNTLN